MVDPAAHFVGLSERFYCYDNPSAMKQQLSSHFSDTMDKADQANFELLYSVYSIPNVILLAVSWSTNWALGPRWWVSM